MNQSMRSPAKSEKGEVSAPLIHPERVTTSSTGKAINTPDRTRRRDSGPDATSLDDLRGADCSTGQYPMILIILMS